MTNALASALAAPAAVRDAALLARDPEGFLSARRAELGDPFRVRLPGVGAVLVTGDPEGAREIFGADAATFEPLHDNPVEPLLGRHSLILLGGERHRRERKLMMPPFHGDRMRAYGELFSRLTRDEIDRWSPGRPIVLQDAMRRITLEVILRAVFGVQDAARRAGLRDAIGELLDAYTGPLVVLPALRKSFGGVGPWARFERARAAFRALLHEEIATRRAPGAPLGDDVLSLLVAARYDDGTALSPSELADELSTLLVAGHETAATALTWALASVHADPAIAARAEAELSSEDAAPSPERMAELPFLGAVVSEALRVHPVVPIVVRRVVRPFALRGAYVPEGGVVAVATTLLHAHARAFPDAARFRPDRFLARRFTPFEYAPFGGGVRRCLGAAFATYEMKIVLGTLFARARFAAAPAPPDRPILHNITMGPRAKIRLVFVGS